jgi:hypothetical protein
MRWPTAIVLLQVVCALLVCGCRNEAASPPHGRAASSGAEHEPSTAPAAEPLGTLYGPETTTIEAQPGERFSLALPHDPALTWKLDPELDQSVTRVVEQRTDASTHYVLFDAVGIGPTDVRLRQRGPDSPAPGPAAREVSIRVRVELAQ